jgi:hypothetical protein
MSLPIEAAGSSIEQRHSAAPVSIPSASIALSRHRPAGVSNTATICPGTSLIRFAMENQANSQTAPRKRDLFDARIRG